MVRIERFGDGSPIGGGWSRLPEETNMDKHKISERIRGAFTGYAVGNALGLGTEFMTRDEVRANYPDTLTRYDQIVPDAHRSLWGAGHWTHDTYFLMMLANNIMRDRRLDPMAFAQGMYEWYAHGRYDIPTQLRLVLREDDYPTDPYGTVNRVWNKIGNYSESSSVLGVAALAGMYTREPQPAARDLCATLQTGPRALGCCHIVNKAVSDLLWHERVMTQQETAAISREYSLDIEPFVDYAAQDRVEDARVDDEETLWWVRKAMCTGLWALWHATSFEQGLDYVVNLGGDADTNGGLAAIFLGLRFGRESIPAHLTDHLVHIDNIEETGRRWAEFLIQDRGL